MSRYLNITALLFSCVLLCSGCKKPEDQFGYVRSLSGDHHENLRAVLKLDDGNFIVASSNINVDVPGKIQKISSDGSVFWNKDLPSQNLYLIKTIAVNGVGFLTYGYQYSYDSTMYLYMYDYSGNILHQDSILANFPNYNNTYSNIIRMSDGKFMVVQTPFDFDNNYIRVYMLSPELKKTKVRTVFHQTYLSIAQSRSMCQLEDGSVQIGITLQEWNQEVYNLLMLRFSQSGDYVGSRFLANSDSSESASVMIPYNNGTLVLSSAMKGAKWGSNDGSQDSNGVMVRYIGFGYREAFAVSGRIFLRTFSSSLVPTGKTAVTGYPNNGMIHSIRKAADGGYLLCGTVNQLGTNLVTSYTRIYLIRLDASLNTVWSKIIPTTYPAVGCDAIPADDGSIMVFGHQKSLGLKSSVIIIKTDENGNF